MTTLEDTSYTAEPPMCATTSAETKPEEQKPQSHQGNWDCQAWSWLACCSGGNTANGADCVNAINVCCAGILVGLGEVFNALTGCCTSCCHGCGQCCGSCCSGSCCG